MPCSRIQRRRARATSGRACSAARRLFFKGDVVPNEKTRQSTAASDDPSLAHRRNRFVQRQIRLLGNQRQQPARVLLQGRDASATGLRCGAAVIAPAPEPVDHGTRAHFEKPRHLVSRGATLDDRYRSTPQVVRIRLGHPKILPKRIKNARLAHPLTFGNPPDSTRQGYALEAIRRELAALLMLMLEASNLKQGGLNDQEKSQHEAKIQEYLVRAQSHRTQRLAL